ncbi:MAG: hypothetical protein HFG40_01105 [Bacilli bacterium]|nr:hypothetical protein [Bacilli bacterium]
MELIFILLIALFVMLYRSYKGQNVYKFVTEQVGTVYDKFAPYSFKVVREKTKELGQEYTIKQYTVQIVTFAAFAAIISYMYFYNIVVSLVYIVLAISVIPYLAYLRCKRVYSEFIFEQVQIYTTNTIMEFATTQSFVKALEGVASSGVLEEPILGDVNMMISLAYQNGSIDESIQFMSAKYPYYIVKNMHQLFLQITKEGSKDSGESLENMQLDIDMLVESVYRDRMDRANFHKGFLKYGVMLYLMVMLVQYLLGRETYIAILGNPLMLIILHAVLIVNSYFLLRGEKYYNENVGAE